MDMEKKMAWEAALVRVSAFAARAHEGQLRKDGKTPTLSTQHVWQLR